MVQIGNDWDAVLAEDFASENYRALREFLKTEYRSHTIYPGMPPARCRMRTPPTGRPLRRMT